MKRRSATLFLALFSSFLFQHLGAQVPEQTIRGKVFDRVSLLPLEGVTVQLENENFVDVTLTDSIGQFSFTNIETGRYRLKFLRMNYHAQSISILLNAGKEQVLKVALSEQPIALEEITITAEQQISNDPFEVEYLSSRTFTVEESQRFAATFYDPSRVVAAGPGVNITNDQANHIVVRGNSPNGILWKLEGADIVNPNHLTNAGTMTDHASLTGGGVSILSMQLLDRSRFLSGAFPAGYGNALSGVFDMQLRKGNNQKHEYTAQASLLGIDMAAEGPLSKSYEGAFLINYRYSTLGLFSSLGIPIGDEIINFQDISFNLSLPTSRFGDFTFFGIAGKSITTFEGVRDSSEWKYQKDRTDVDFHSHMGVIGATHSISLNEKSGINSVVALSKNESKRIEDYIFSDYTTQRIDKGELSAQKLSLSSYYYRELSKWHRIKLGAIINKDGFQTLLQQNYSFSKKLATLNEVKEDYVVYQPYFNWQFKINPKLIFSTGLHFVYADFNEAFSAEPRLSFKYNVNSSSYISAAYGLHSQFQHPAIYFNLVEENKKLGFTKAHHLVLGYTRWLSNLLSIKLEAYYQSLFDVPVHTEHSNGFSALNIMESAIITEKLSNEGTGKNYGIDFSSEKSMEKEYYFIVAASVYSSKYTGSDKIERNTRFNGNYLSRVTAGKELEMVNKSNKHVLGLNLSINYSGGLRYTPINDRQAEKEHYQSNHYFSKQLNDFFRMDVRFLWRKDKENYTRTLALDVQNLSNAKNPAYYYYDSHKKSIVVKNQLGIIPFISYRVEF